VFEIDVSEPNLAAIVRELEMLVAGVPTDDDTSERDAQAS